MYYLSVVVRTEKNNGMLPDLDCLARAASVSWAHGTESGGELSVQDQLSLSTGRALEVKYGCLKKEKRKKTLVLLIA